MNLTAFYLIGTGIILCILGLYFLYRQYTTPAPNEKYAWGGLGDNPFKKKR